MVTPEVQDKLLIFLVLLSTPVAASGPRRVMDINYEDTHFTLQEEYARVDTQAAQVRLSMFLTRALQGGSSRKEAMRQVLHQVLQEHRRRLPQVRKQVQPMGALNETSLRQWFATSLHRQAANTFFQMLPTPDYHKPSFTHGVHNATWSTSNGGRSGHPAVDSMTRRRSPPLQEGHGRVRRDDPAVMYLPVGGGGGSGDCPDAIDAAAVSISQLVFLSLSLGVFTAVANIANNINNNNNNNNNNNDNNINSNNLNFAANANSGNQITIQLPPPTGRGKREVHELWQQHLAALQHRRANRAHHSKTQQRLAALRKSMATKVLQNRTQQWAKQHRATLPSRATDEDPPESESSNENINLEFTDSTPRSQHSMDLTYEVTEPDIITKKFNPWYVEGTLSNKQHRPLLTKEKSDTYAFRSNPSKTIIPSSLDDSVNPLNDPNLDEHHKRLLPIADRYSHYLPLQEVPRLLRRLYSSHDPTETSDGISSSSTRDVPLPTSSVTDSSLPLETDHLPLPTVGVFNVSASVPSVSDVPSLSTPKTRASLSASGNADFLPSIPSSTADPASLGPQERLQGSFVVTPPAKDTTPATPHTVSAEGVGATWALKATMTWAVWASMSSPPCLGHHLCQILQKAPKGNPWSHALAGYYLQTALSGHVSHTFSSYLKEAQQGHCRHLFPDCSDPTTFLSV